MELAITLRDPDGSPSLARHLLAAAFFGVAVIFIYRSFYGMRIVERRENQTVERPHNVPAVAGK